MSTQYETLPIWQMSACDLAAAIQSGKTSCVAAVADVSARVHAENGRINAIVEDMTAAALPIAETHDQILQTKGPLGPLQGVPVTIKVNVDQKGHATTNGVTALKDVIAPEDAPIVRNLKNAGAIVIGRTNTPEFSFRATTDNALYGRTLNPWDEMRSPGGSSGGASAALAAGFGAIAREMRDVRLATKVMAAHDPRDPWQVPVPFDGPPISQPLKVAVARETNGYPIEPAMTAASDKAAATLEAAGHEVEEVDPSMLKDAAHDALASLFGDLKLFVGKALDTMGSPVIQTILGKTFDIYKALGPEGILQAMARRTAYTRAWNVFAERYPLILTPFMMRMTYDWDEDTRGPAAIAGILDSSVYSGVIHYLGLPAAIAPAGFHNGLPISVQIVGRRFRDELTLDGAEVLEQARGVAVHELWQRQGLRG